MSCWSAPAMPALSSPASPTACRKQISALIYLNAALPTNGQCMLDTVPAERRAAVVKLADDEGDGYRIPTSLVLDTGIADETARREFLSRMSPHPLPSLLQPIRLTGKYLGVPQQGLCAGDEENLAPLRRISCLGEAGTGLDRA